MMVAVNKMVKMQKQTFILVFMLSSSIAQQYTVDDTPGMGRMFDGIGGLSGGGATSKLLPNYPEPQRSQILDYLFKPNFGASLQILKVEIGGDAQSTEGTEASHMHNEWDENYNRGYEWWLMTEAKKRNPDIKLYGLPWGFPGWLGKGSGSPYEYPIITATYITKWILAAKKYYNLTMDYIGIWNERPYDINYIVTLRNTLDKNNLQHVKIIAPDGGWDIAKDIGKNATLKKSMYGIGAHYPGTLSSTEAQNSGLQLWASEDYSTFNDNVGAGCWARLLNQNYVNGYMTSTISWNLIAAYYNNLPFPRCALMTATEPWSGHYVVESPIWVTAHTTQFTQIGWTYLKHGSGTGKLNNGGSYVSLLSPDKKDFTMVIETMSHDHSICIRPPLPKYNVSSQSATFKLKGSLAQLSSLHVWGSKLGFDGKATTLMKKQNDTKITGGSFTFQLEPDTIYTLSTVSTATKGQLPTPPASKPLDLPYNDNFDKYPEHSEVFDFVPQTGSFEIMKSTNASRGMINRQMVQETPIYWCTGATAKPITLGGNYNWSDVKVSIDAFVPAGNGTSGVFLAARVDKGGCQMNSARGIFLWMYPDTKTFLLTADLAQKLVVNKGTVPIAVNKWFTISFATKGNQVLVDIEGQKQMFNLPSDAAASGFIAYGAQDFGIVDFDNLRVEKPSTHFIQKNNYQRAQKYIIDDTPGMGRTFDGIGGLSGGGASSKLLPNYPEPQRSEILDYLFKPNFGASLQILKVEIGGDTQSGMGSEASHMHNEWDENYSRGYEWWLMTEAKKRNPDIKLYGLPWGFPGWLGKGSGSPYKYPNITATYITKWILAAKKYYNLTMDYIGIWNERPYDVNYIVTLRNTLDMNNLQHVKIIAPDLSWVITKDVNKNATLKKSLFAIGAHYPGTFSSTEAQKTELQLWASEDYSTFNDNIGAGCWARLLNRNYVNGYMTSTISWNLIAAYYNNLPFARDGLMTATEPWSGHYVVESPIWVTAHTTQFTQIGWTYLKHGSGTGKLNNGGSYVSLLSPDKKDFTMVIETMSHDHSICIRPPLPKYNVSSQSATFKLQGSQAQFSSLYVWYSKLGFNGKATTLLKKQKDMIIIKGSFTLQLEPDTIYTLSTVSTATKGQLPTPPASKPLNLPYYDNFDKYAEHSEVFNFVPQMGSFEVLKSSDVSKGMINRQTVQETPIFWSTGAGVQPIILGGNYNWSDVRVSIEAFVPTANGTNAVVLAARVDKGGIYGNEARGIFLWMYPGNKTFLLTADITQKLIITKGTVSISVNKWFTISFATKGKQVFLDIDGQKKMFNLPSDAAASGFIAYGTHDFGIADFDNFKVEKPTTVFTEDRKSWRVNKITDQFQRL